MLVAYYTFILVGNIGFECCTLLCKFNNYASYYNREAWIIKAEVLGNNAGVFGNNAEVFGNNVGVLHNKRCLSFEQPMGSSYRERHESGMSKG